MEQSRSINSLEKIKNKYILKQILDNLRPIILLKLLKYNKSLQNKIDKKLSDYKKEYSKIVIEIIPAENKYGTFINIYNNKQYYHIYFNDDKEETKRKEITKEDKISKIKIVIDYEIKSLYKLFEYCRCIRKINFIKFNRKDIKIISFMFSGCSSLEELNFSYFNTDNVTTLKSMFSGCCSLKEIDLSNFNTDNKTNMNYIFWNCSSLEKLNLSIFN